MQVTVVQLFFIVNKRYFCYYVVFWQTNYKMKVIIAIFVSICNSTMLTINNGFQLNLTSCNLQGNTLIL